SVTKIRPSLVPFIAKEAYIPELQGVSLKNVEVTIKNGKKELFREFGEMLFTHYGVSGPLLLSASGIVNDAIQKGPLDMTIDLKPAITAETLDKRILREFEENHNKQFKNAITDLFPSKMIPVMIELSGISPEKKVNEISKVEREFFVKCIKAMPLTLIGLRGFNEAIITRGGVNVKEINPSTMESKLIKNLYFAGELMDVDALTGGYNLQIAWSTGVLAGRSIT
ncbi:MAG: aminoacetone oxidase family FAD-binding enzyme, partial [Lachnospiraceae bacterium]